MGCAGVRLCGAIVQRLESAYKAISHALGTAIIKARLELMDEELVKRIKVNLFLQLFIGLGAFQVSAPFDSSMMVDFRKCLPEAVVNGCNERIVRHGLKVMRSSDSQDPSDDGGSGDGSVSLADHPRPSTQKQPNQGSRLIDATCAPVDICHPEEVVSCSGHEEAAPDQQDRQSHQARARPPEAESGEH